MNLRFYITCFALCVVGFAHAQSALTVLDLKNKPVSGAMVYIRCIDQACNGKTDYLYTDEKGIVQIKMNGTVEAQIRKIGFEPKKITIPKGSSLTIVLKESPNDLEEFVITGEYEKTSTRETVQKVRIIDSKRILAQGAVNLKDLLANELNIRISQDNILGAGLSLQGVSGQNVKILIDGVPVVGRMNGNIDLTQINLNNIERIEIIEGPMSVAYGTDALGGVINLITKKAGKKKYSASLQSYYETIGQYNLNGTLGFAHGRHQLKFNGGRNFFDGYTSKDYYNTNIAPNITNENYTETYKRKQQWLPKLQYFSDLNYIFKIKNGEVSYQCSWFDEKVINKGLPTITSYDAYSLDDYYLTTRINQSVFLNLRLKNNANLNLINAYSIFDRTKNVYRKDLVSLDQILVPVSDDQSHTFFSNWNFRGTYSTRQHKMLNYQLGYDVSYQKGKGDLEKGNPYMTDAAAFMSLEYKPVNRLKIMPAARAAYNSRFSVPIVPSLNIKYDLSSAWTLRASYGNGFRAPSLKEMNMFFFDFNHSIQGNPDLKPENSHNFNLVVTGRQAGANKVLTFEPSLYYNRIYNMISLAVINAQVSPPLYTYVNIDTYKTFGTNLQSEFKFKTFSISAGYSSGWRYNSLSATTKSVNTWSRTEEYRLNTTYQYMPLQLTGSMFYKFNGALPGYAVADNGDVVQTKIGSYTLLDASLSKPFIKNKLTISVGAKNLMNITNINNNGATSGSVHGSGSSMPVAWGRTFFAQLLFNI